MSAFLIAAIVMLAALVPCGVVVLKGSVMQALAAFEAAAAVIVLILLLIAEGFGRSGEFELPLLSAVLAYGSGLVFVRLLERRPRR